MALNYIITREGNVAKIMTLDTDGTYRPIATVKDGALEEAMELVDAANYQAP